MTATAFDHRTAAQADLQSKVPDHVARLGWDPDRVRSHQTSRLRDLLSHAAEHSPFHAGRLAGSDVAGFELEDLASLPTMTKATMMAQFDDVVTDRRLTLSLVDRSLSETGSEARLIFDRYAAMASGGSSGTRGVFVYPWESLTDYLLALVRPAVARLMAMGGPPPGGVTMAMVAAGSAIHATRLLSAIYSGPLISVTQIPVTDPIDRIVARLNELQPMMLQAYSSMLVRLAREQRSGRLAIRPISVTGTSEHFPLEDRAVVADVFGVPVVDQFGSSEGVLGSTAPGGDVIQLASDCAIVELVDDEHRPVPIGVPSAKALVTSLINPLQPLIRYELTDRFVAHPTVTGHLAVTVEGRTDDSFTFGDRIIHPFAIRSVMTSNRSVVEYQVRQTGSGIAASVVASQDVGDLGRRLEEALEHAGLVGATAIVDIVDRIERHPATGKARRFVPLP